MKWFSLFACILFFASTSSNAQIINTIVGDGGSMPYGGDGIPAISCAVYSPLSTATDDTGNVYCTTWARICKITNDGIIHTLAGTGVLGHSGDGGLATAAKINGVLSDMAIDKYGNMYFGEMDSSYIRKISATGIITTIAGTGTGAYTGDGGAASLASFDGPSGIAIDDTGNLYIADKRNNCIRKIHTDGTITTIVGTGAAGFSGDGGPAISAKLNHPADVAIDALGNLYISDDANYRIRRVDAVTGLISTVAGIGSPGFSGDGFPATAALLYAPKGIVVDAPGNIVFSDLGNNVIRKINNAGIITTIAGIGTMPGFSGDGGPATAAKLMAPINFTIDDTGNIFIADKNNNRLRKISSNNHLPFFTGGSIQTLGLCADSSRSIDALLGVTDADAGQILTWNTINGPLHGAAVATYTTTSTGGIAGTSALSYNPNPGYSGADTMRVRVDDGVSAARTTIYINIDHPAIAGTLSNIKDTVCKSDTTGFHASVAGGTWSSSNPAIASVSSAGTVSGIATGSAIITYRVTNACSSAFVTRTIAVKNCPSAISTTEITQNGLHVWPNPISDNILFLRVSSHLAGQASITISDASGRAVKGFELSTNKDGGIELELTTGIYFVYAITATDNFYVPIVVTR